MHPITSSVSQGQRSEGQTVSDCSERSQRPEQRDRDARAGFPERRVGPTPDSRRRHHLGRDAAPDEAAPRTPENRDQRNFDETGNRKRRRKTPTSSTGTVTSGRAAGAGPRLPSSRSTAVPFQPSKASAGGSPFCSKPSSTPAGAGARSVRCRARVDVAGATGTPELEA